MNRNLTSWIRKQRITRIHDLELKRQNGLHQANLIHRDEEARRLKLQLLSAQHENTLLEGRFNQKSIQCRQVSKQSEKIRVQLHDAKGTIHGQDIRLKKQAVEINNSKVWNDKFQVRGQAG